jgi:hypothetical protein
MKEVTAKTANKSAQNSKAGKAISETTALDHYRQIGISAVAAAARYQGTAKDPQYAPLPSAWRTGDAAAWND